MKTNYRFLIVLIAFAFCLTTNRSQAQEPSSWEWEQYGISFESAKDFKVERCSDAELMGAVGAIHLTATPFSDMGVSEDNLEDYVIQMATDQDFDELSDTEDLDLNGFSASYISGVKNGKHTLLMVMLDDEGATSFMVTLSYPKLQKEAAVGILESFSKTDLDDEDTDEPVGDEKSE